MLECEMCEAHVPELVDLGWILACEACADSDEVANAPAVDAREDFARGT